MATTSGTTTFDLDLNEIIEEAYERVGAESRTGYDFKTARRSLNLMFSEWANRGINLWTMEQGTIALIADQADYGLPVGTVDLIEHTLRTGTGTSQSDLPLTRISASTYAAIPNKNLTGRPIQIFIDRLSGQTTTDGVHYPTFYLWPIPDQSNYYTMVGWRLRRIQDAGNGANIQDVPYRFMPVMIAGLAYYLSLKIPGGLERTPLLKQMYDEAWMQAADEDREKATLRIVPRFR